MSDSHYLFPLSAIATGIFWWLLINGFRTGNMEFPQWGQTYGGNRSNQPVRFWLTAGCLGFVAVGGLIAIIGTIFFPSGFWLG